MTNMTKFVFKIKSQQNVPKRSAESTLTDDDQYLDRKFLKYICSFIFFCGFGSCWYIPSEKSFSIPPRVYRIWYIICNVYCITVISLEVLANFRTDFTVKERNDAVQFSIAHPTIYIKLIVFTLKRSKIADFLKILIEDLRVSNTVKIEREAVRKAKNFVILMGLAMFGCVLLTTIDNFNLHFREGASLGVLKTLWPRRESKGIIVEIANFLIQIFWWYFITSMVAVDILCLSSMIFLSSKFKLLQSYFQGLRKTFLQNVHGKTVEELEEDLKKGFIRGIKLHSQTLWCSRSLQQSMGIVFSSQVIQSIALLAVCLIKLVSQERDITFLVANFSFIFDMLVLTGTYMVAGGDITYEASRVSTSMFYCGWELCRARARLRPLVVVALQCANRPVVMTAFGIYDLSYNNFIGVLRSSYSFFAVMY